MTTNNVIDNGTNNGSNNGARESYEELRVTCGFPTTEPTDFQPNSEVKANPSAERVLRHRYKPRGTARALFHERAGEVLVSGPAGTGKSRACLEKLLALALKNSGFKGLIIRKTAVSLASSALATWKKDVAAEVIAAGLCVYYGGSRQEPAQYKFHNGSSVVIGGMDKPTKIMSTEYDVIYVQEATELDIEDWEALTTRLRNNRISFQQLLADCNPDRPTHWLKQRADGGTTVMLDSRHEDNPTLFDDAGTLTERGGSYIAKLDALTGVRKQRLRYGKWVAAEGGIYQDTYNPFVNVINRADWPLKPHWRRFWSVDFGFTNPFVLQCWAEDEDGRLYLYRELYRTQRLVEDHARDILRIVTRRVRGAKDTEDDPLAALLTGKREWTEPQPDAIICDHDAEDRATLERHLGMDTKPAHKAVSDGIQAVASRFRVADDGRPRLYVYRNALHEPDPLLQEGKRPLSTLDEIPGYVWDQRSGKALKESPRKEDDHGCDAMRYIVADRDIGGTLNVRRLQ
ncbi:phage terminase large subunit [Amycolatopsis sp. WQ 127309]|uniref:phage terminase large subunit n=1 Tax=Amycolatopsis sp. WQ 127309 TaxID=2932773 RepID=UPI001FF680DF|nr:phage terminase large subunit [Amycolatopsis sp. WQ 127309]UOZ10532.1 phage terminase large subunit [Amycolatopsis sp. WQ 127309]